MKEFENIVKDIKNKRFFPVYFLMGEEPYFIDKITNLLEETVLTEEEKSFNLTISYSKDASLEEIISICKQYPMASERTLVIVKEAQNLFKSIDLLENYLINIQSSTILVINYKDKTLDKRKKLYKLINEKGLIVESKKVYENYLPQWINTIVKQKNLSIDPKASFLFQEYIGNDLSRIENEVDKIKVHLKENETITLNEIEKYIGISKEYNVFELINAISFK
ncbi:MAG: DNA polymerase III subunit delta, partial [Solirubrobacteraceae bacterium]